MVVVFAEGRIEAIGKHDELSKTSETYRKLYGLHLTERLPTHHCMGRHRRRLSDGGGAVA